ncbi:MAG TPA: AMP-dependent synthetase [Deltaproteobacteria bacterium]|nr:AMP-dependent synthetase [Deltaproteobacteria bacterium]
MRPVEHPHVPPVTTLVQLLQWRAAHQADRVGFTFLVDGETQQLDWTYAALDRRSRAVAAWLQAQGAEPGDRVLVMFHEGLDYLAALFGCMYAQVLAVPVHPPDPRRLSRTLPRLINISQDASIRFAATTADIAALARDEIGAHTSLAGVRWLCLDQVEQQLADAYVDPGAGPDDIAYLQYTSGSTALPKGVMISHHNLLHQLADFDTGYDHRPDSVMVTWLPATHDLGLVYGRFMPLFIGFRCVFFSPAAFMQRPARWPVALSRFGGTHSPSPNFGLEVAALKTPPEVIASLDLSRVRVVLNGAEPIRRASEAAFLEAFTRAGLPPAAVTHAMGMSESTAKIITEPIDRYPARFVDIDPEAYERNEVIILPEGTEGARVVASNGTTVLDTRVEIVDPDSHDKLGSDRVGEMWVSGTTVAQGYYNNPEATERTFRAHTSDGDGPFLRTGDLAFVHDGEVYLAGRLKDVLIIRGQNHHPQDIEWSVASAHPALRPNCAAAFGITEGTGEEGEQLVLITEVYPDKIEDPEAIFGAMRQAISDHGIAARALVLMPPRALPKTSSGKIQRTKARQRFLDGDLPVLHRWDHHAPTQLPEPDTHELLLELRAARGRRRHRLLVAHVVAVAAGLLGLDPEDIEEDRPFGELGLDSVTAVEMVEQIGRTVGHEIAGTVLFDHPTIDDLCRWILSDLLTGERAAPTAAAPTSADVVSMSDEEAEQALLREIEDL